MASKRAQIRGVLFGVLGGIIAGSISRKSLNLSKNASLLSGLLAGTGVAYVMAQQELEHDLSHLEKTQSQLKGSGQRLRPFSSSPSDEMERLDLKSADERNFEAGVGGLHELRDKYATTRGDH
ncbi:hypothetical protein IE53DRAFT_388595 [Violaceomyces palustris]|uniref:Uncharacterized protein n=1 Tax=Violaceomyces palustris TaxID=1673888 RepID=A0ACD0NTS5_9BASI|nr:hypothetical protein IE53DRAFT_388595 [Violaceomyces palustris]